MSIRPPRPTRPRRPAQVRRELPIIIVTAAAIVVLGLRMLLAAFAVDEGTAAWRLVGRPTQPIVDLLERVEFMRRTPLGNLAIADLALAFAGAVAALFILASLVNRRVR
jgi:hypothetical protein